MISSPKNYDFKSEKKFLHERGLASQNKMSEKLKVRLTSPKNNSREALAQKKKRDTFKPEKSIDGRAPIIARNRLPVSPGPIFQKCVCLCPL